MCYNTCRHCPLNLHYIVADADYERTFIKHDFQYSLNLEVVVSNLGHSGFETMCSCHRLRALNTTSIGDDGREKVGGFFADATCARGSELDPAAGTGRGKNK